METILKVSVSCSGPSILITPIRPELFSRECVAAGGRQEERENREEDGERSRKWWMGRRGKYE